MQENPYLQFVQKDSERDVRSSMLTAIEKSPDTEAKLQDLARRYNMPVEAVRLNEPEVKRRAAFESVDYETLARDLPGTSSFLSNPENAAISHDNIENMGSIERTVRGLGPAAMSGLLGASAGVVGAVQAPVDLLAPILDPLAGTILPENPLRRVASGLSGYRQSIEADSKAWMPQGQGTVERGIFSGVGSLSRNLAALPLALTPGGQSAALTAMTVPVAGQEYGTARDNGLTPFQAATYGASQAAIEYATEKLPVSRLIGDLSSNVGLGKLLARQAAAEVPGEQLATVLQDLNEWAVLKPDATFADYLKDRPGAAAETLIATLVGVGGQTTLMKGIDTAINHAERKAQKAQEAERAAQEAAKLSDLVKADKVLQRSPQAFEQFIKQATEDGPVPLLYIDAQTLMQSGVAEQLAQVSPAVAEQIEEAAATGGQVAIPVGEYAARIAPTDFAQSLIEHIKTEPDGFSLAEAQEYMQTQAEQLQAEVERTLTDKAADDVFVQSQEVVKAQIQQELDALGRFTPQKNEADATLFASYYAVRAAQLGVTPEALYDKRRVRFAAEAVAGQQFQQVAIDTPEFSNWFGDSKVVDSAGKPLVVYRGRQRDYVQMERDSEASNFSYGAEPDSGGLFFHPDLSEVNYYMEGSRGYVPGANVMPVFLSLKNPAKINSTASLEVQARALREAETAGHDGAFLSNGDIVVFRPEQIKSATGNRGTFDPNDPNILNQQARGAFSPESFTITLLKGADLSTALHEGAHFFFENDIALAAELVKENNAFGSDTQPDGQRQIISDVSTLLRWHGISGTVEEQLATWYGMDFEAKRVAHERTAESFEKYLFDGQAPSLELAPYFQKFRAWMLSVYKSIKDFLTQNPEAGKLDDTVRGVFDRMLATGEQIKIAEQNRSMLPLFANPEQAGMTPEEFKAYQDEHLTATSEAIETMQARGLRDLAWTRNARGREIKKLQKKAAGLRSEARMDARREIMSRPVYRAWEFLTATENGGKLYLNPADVTIDAEISQRLDELKMTATDGAIPDVMAEQFGYSSGDELIRDLAAAQDPETAIEDMTDRLMLERHGDIATPQGIEAAADKAIFNEARARMIATEAAALAQASGEKKMFLDAAKQFAGQVVARLKVRDLQPSRFANAAARAGVNADKASKAGDIQTAATEKRNQVVQTLAAKAANDARDEIDSAIKYLRKFGKEGTRKNLDTGYLEQIDALLDKHDLSSTATQADRKQSLSTWVKSRLNAGEIPAISESLLTPSERAEYLAQVQSRDDKGDLIYRDDEAAIDLLAQAIDRSAKRSHKDMTVEEFRGLVETVKNIEHLARLKTRLLTAREQKSYEAIRDEIAGGIVDNAAQSGKNTKTANDWLGKKLEAIKSFGASHIKVATWARIMDGGKENGPVWRFIVQPANERATMETTMRAQATEALDAIMRPLLSKVPMADKAGKGKHFQTLGRSLNWQERFAMALNVGNESNMQRLLGGDGWTFAQIKPVLDSLTAEEWTAVQAVWDHFETYRPLIAEKELRVTGKEPEWIQARRIDVSTADGQRLQLRGGYFPVVFDPRVNMKAEADAKSQEFKDLSKAAYSAATTRRGFTKSRVEELHGRPLLLNLQGLYSGVNDVIHDLAWHEWVIDANKLLKSKTIDNAIREHYGPEVKREFEKWRDDIVVGSRRMDSQIEKAVGYLRQSLSASALTFNLLTAAMQPLGLANSVSRVGAQWIGKGVARYVSSPFQSTGDAMEKSAWLKNRTRTRFRELNELRNQVQGQTSAKELMGRYGYWLMMRTQLMVDVPTWWGGYEKAIAAGHDEDTAVQLADQGVKDAQGGGEEVDQSGIERGGPLMKIFTTFYSYMGSTLNTAYLAGKTESSKAKAVANIALVTMTPAILGALLKDALVPGGGDDDEDLLKKFASEQIGFLLGMVVVGREFSQAAKMAFGEYSPGYGGPAGLRAIGDITKLTQQTAQGEFDDGFRRAFISVLGDLTGIPSVQINRTWTGIEAVSDGQTEGPVEGGAAITFGIQR